MEPYKLIMCGFCCGRLPFIPISQGYLWSVEYLTITEVLGIEFRLFSAFHLRVWLPYHFSFNHHSGNKSNYVFLVESEHKKPSYFHSVNNLSFHGFLFCIEDLFLTYLFSGHLQ